MRSVATGSVCQPVCTVRALKLLGVQIHSENIQVLFVYPGHRVKVKVTGFNNNSAYVLHTKNVTTKCVE